MPIAKGSSLDPERTRSAMLGTATAVFYERGLDGVGVAELCARTGASKETLYRHFGSKDGLIEAVLEVRSARVHDWIAAAAEAAGDEPADRLAAIFDALGGWHAEPGYRGCAIVNAATQRHGDPARAVAARHLGRYLELLTGIARSAGVADPELLGRQWLLLMQGANVVADHYDEGGTADLAKRTALELLAEAVRR